MKNLTLLLFAVGILGLSSCNSGALDLYHDEELHPQLPSERVTVRAKIGIPLAVTEITDPAQIARLTEFINALPNKWSVPWEGPRKGEVFFTFHRGRATIGNFYVGPGFFGRDQNNSFSQPATASQMQQVGEITGIDLTAYAPQKKP